MRDKKNKRLFQLLYTFGGLALVAVVVYFLPKYKLLLNSQAGNTYKSCFEECHNSCRNFKSAYKILNEKRQTQQKNVTQQLITGNISKDVVLSQMNKLEQEYLAKTDIEVFSACVNKNDLGVQLVCLNKCKSGTSMDAQVEGGREKEREKSGGTNNSNPGKSINIKPI